VRDISVGARTLVVNKGGNDGLVEPGGDRRRGALVGRIQTVDPTAAKILLISDFTAVVVGKEVKSGARRNVQGSISGQLQRLAWTAPDVAKDTERQPVVTAGEFLAAPTTHHPTRRPLIRHITSVTSDQMPWSERRTVAPAAH